MFVPKENKGSRVATRAADAIDLMIEFVTLGEYGLEYPGPVPPSSRKSTTPRSRTGRALTTIRQDAVLEKTHGIDAARHGAGPQKHRHGRRPCRPGRTRIDLPGWTERPGHEMPGVQPGRRHKVRSGHSSPSTSPRNERNRPSPALPEALRPPRIRFEAA